MPAKTMANTPKNVKSVISLGMSIGLRINCLAASVVYDIGLTLAIIGSGHGMIDVGNRALLAKRSGRFNRFITAIWVSILVERMAMKMKIEDSPTLTRNKAPKTPKRLITVKSGPGVNPNKYAMNSTMAA